MTADAASQLPYKTMVVQRWHSSVCDVAQLCYFILLFFLIFTHRVRATTRVYIGNDLATLLHLSGRVKSEPSAYLHCIGICSWCTRDARPAFGRMLECSQYAEKAMWKAGGADCKDSSRLILLIILFVKYLGNAMDELHAWISKQRENEDTKHTIYCFLLHLQFV